MGKRLIIGLIAALLAVPAFSGELDKVRKSVRDKPTKKQKKKKKVEHDDPERKVKDKPSIKLRGPWLTQGVVRLVGLPFTIPHAGLGDRSDNLGYFESYPYESDEPFVTPRFDRRRRNWDAWVRGDYLQDFDNLDRGNVGLFLTLANRVGVEGDVGYWRESSSGADDHLWIGDANLTYRFAQGEKMQFRTGVGINWLSDSAGREFGINVTYGWDIYPRRPWVFSTEFDFGTLGNAGLFHARTTAGVQVRQAEVFVGYDYLGIGAADLDGIVGGLRLRF